MYEGQSSTAPRIIVFKWRVQSFFRSTRAAEERADAVNDALGEIGRAVGERAGSSDTLRCGSATVRLRFDGETRECRTRDLPRLCQQTTRRRVTCSG